MNAESNFDVVGRVPPPGDLSPRRLRRLHRVWSDGEGNISYLLTLCVEGRLRVLDNEATLQRLAAFLLDSPGRYHWFGRRFVIMPDHLHLIAHQGHNGVRLGQWIKALKAVVGGLERRVGARGLQGDGRGMEEDLHRAATPGEGTRPTGGEFHRIPRPWRWQEGYHDHKFRTPESESRKWEYICMNPVRAGLVKWPEEWPYGGEIFYDETADPQFVPGTPALLEAAVLIEDERQTPRGGTRPTI